MEKNINIELIIERTQTAFNCTNQKQLAELFNISPDDFSSRKRRGTLTKLIEKEAFRRHISYDWIITGQGAMMSGHRNGTTIGEINAPYNATPLPIRISDPLIQKTAAILESQTTYSTALKSNIVAFHHAMTCEEQLDLANKRIDTLEEHVKAIESRLPKVNES